MFEFKSPKKVKAKHNFAKSQKDYAVFLPAISSIFVKIASMTDYNLRNQLPHGLNSLSDLDFLSENTPFFYYPAGLYSAGHAGLNAKAAYDSEGMIHKRDRKNTVIIGDSGGFQVATGVLKWPWEQGDMDEKTWISKKDDVRLKILRWLEDTADYSQVLDFPTSSHMKFEKDPVTGQSLHPGLRSFGDCLKGSLENYDFFIKNRREGMTKFMNALQGNNQEEGDIWWEAVKDLPFETWSFANVQASNMAINLRRLIVMRDGKYLDGRDWIHYLGTGKIRAACAITQIQRALRKHVNPELTLSFDAASPFVMTAKGQLYKDYDLKPSNLGYKSGPMVDDKTLKGSIIPYNDYLHQTLGSKYRSAIGDSVTVGDICVKGYEDLEFKKIEFTKKELLSKMYHESNEGKCGDLYKWSPEYIEYLSHHSDNGGLFDYPTPDFSKDEFKYQVKWPSSMDGLSYVLAMSHNVDMHIHAMQEANYYMDQPLDVANQHIPHDLLEFKDLVDEVFISEKPITIINKHKKMLKDITGRYESYDLSRDFEEING